MSYVHPRFGRLTDNDRTFGPVTFGERSATWRPLRAVIQSGDDEYPGCGLYLGAFGWSVRIALPAVVKPWKQWVDTSRHAWSSGACGFWDVHANEYGFSLSDGFLQVFLGPQTMDSTTSKNWCCHLPWTQWNYICIRHYGLKGELVSTLTETLERRVRREVGWLAAHNLRVAAKGKAVVFDVEDYDGQRRQATCHIEEREWHFGTGWFRWLSLFRRAKIRRSMDIAFDHEVGSEKGSWKGGLMGTGIELLPGELHEDAMRRFCANGVRNRHDTTKLTYIGRVPVPAPDYTSGAACEVKGA